MANWNCVYDQVEAGRSLVHRTALRGQQESIRTELLRIRVLIRHATHNGHSRIESKRQLYRHMSKAAQPNNANATTGTDTPHAQRGIVCNIRAEQRGDTGLLKAFGHTQYDVL
jgi:hypothetical protein